MSVIKEVLISASKGTTIGTGCLRSPLGIQQWETFLLPKQHKLLENIKNGLKKVATESWRPIDKCKELETLQIAGSGVVQSGIKQMNAQTHMNNPMVSSLIITRTYVVLMNEYNRRSFYLHPARRCKPNFLHRLHPSIFIHKHFLFLSRSNEMNCTEDVLFAFRMDYIGSLKFCETFYIT